jgi:hypothetical protein
MTELSNAFGMSRIAAMMSGAEASTCTWFDRESK